MITDANAELEQRIEGTVSIPSIPPILASIFGILDSIDGTPAEAAGVLLRNAALAAAAQRLTSSPFYGVRNAAADPESAWATLEPKAIRNLAVQACVLQTFADVRALDAFEPSRLWDHSLKSAVACRLLAKYSQVADGIAPQDAYTCGLIHDVGKLILLRSQPTRFAAAVQRSMSAAVPLAQAEFETFGFHHAHVSALMARRWRLPPAVQSAVCHHHADPANAREWARGLLVRAANTLAHMAAGEHGVDHRGDVLEETSLQTLGLNPAQRAEILFKASEAGLA